MMNDSWKDCDHVRNAIDDCLSGVDQMPSLRLDILRKARGEIKVKKKLSVAFILMLILIVIAAVALAAISLGWTDAAYFLSKETTEGSYESWSGTEKTELVRSLVENGYIAQSSDTETLLSSDGSEETLDTLADSIITQWLSCSSDAVSFRTIVEKVWGSFRYWSLEQKAWYTETMIEANVQQPDFEKYVLPDTGVLSLDSAKKLAIAYTEIWLELPQGTISENNMTYDYVILPQKKLLDDQTTIYTTDGFSPVWLLEMNWEDQSGQSDSCSVEIDPASGEVDLQYYLGKVMYDQFGVNWNQDEAAQAIGTLLSEYQYRSFPAWTLEEKAQWSAAVRPLVLAKEMKTPDFYPGIVKALSYYQYGVPDSDAITDEEAKTIAQSYLLSQSSFDEDTPNMPEPFVTVYDVTDVNSPVWRFHYVVPVRYAAETLEDFYDQVIYTVEIDSHTGAVVSYAENQLTDGSAFNKLLLWM